MNLDIRTPCNNCPFRRDRNDGKPEPVRLTRARVREIVAIVAPGYGNGGTFACHKTTGVAGGKKCAEQSHCAGAIIFAVKLGRVSQYIQVVGRMLRLTEDDFRDPDNAVFDSAAEMLSTAIDNPTPPRRPRGKAKQR